MRYSANYPQRAYYGCSCCGGDVRDTLPEILESEVCMGKGKRRKPRPKKEKCKTGRPHRWLYDTVVTVETGRFMVNGHCAECIPFAEEWERQEVRREKMGLVRERASWNPYRDWHCMRHGAKFEYRITKHERICDDCNKYEVVSTSDDNPDSYRSYRRRPRRFPKRPVQF